MSTFSSQVAASSDDAEQNYATGGPDTMDLVSTDLEILYDGATRQRVGVRFLNVTIANGATINSASLTFTVDAVQSGDITVTIYGEDQDNAGTFTTTDSNMNRTFTTASASWTLGGSGAAIDTQIETSDISTIVKEIVDRAGWVSGNAMVFIMDSPSSTNKREVESYDGEAGDARTLM